MPFIIPNIDNVFWKMACQPYRYANQTWMVHYSNKTKQNIDSKIMSSLLNCMHDIYECTTRLLVVRWDLHPKVYSECNTIVSMFYRKLVITLKRLYPKICFSYAWCREHDRSYKQHYHCAIFIDANIMNHPHTLLSIARKLWVDVSKGTFYTPKGCYYDVHNTDNKNLMLMVYRISYLAKKSAKARINRQCKRYSISRLLFGNKRKAPNRFKNRLLPLKTQPTMINNTSNQEVILTIKNRLTLKGEA